MINMSMDNWIIVGVYTEEDVQTVVYTNKSSRPRAEDYGQLLSRCIPSLQALGEVNQKAAEEILTHLAEDIKKWNKVSGIGKDAQK